MEYLVPIVVGIIASLLAPIVQNIMQAFMQNRATRDQRRRDLVDEWRTGIASAGDEFDAAEEIRSSRWYERLRPYLSEEIRKHFEYGFPRNSSVSVAPLPSRGNAEMVDLRKHRNDLAKRVDELARVWKVD